MALHSTLTKNHVIENWSFANAAARTANGTYVIAPNTDLGKVAYQQDNNTYWRLVGIANPGAAATPTWSSIGGSPSDVSRILVLPLIDGLTGGGATKLDGQSVADFTYGQKVCITLNDADSFYTYQNGAPDATVGDVATPNGKRWRLTGGSGA